MTQNEAAVDNPSRFFVLPLHKQADLAEKHGIDALLYCPNLLELLHVFINQETGEVMRERCNRWDCLFCGHREVDQ